MADKKAVKKDSNPMADAANWNARCITEMEAPHKWAEAWGQLFQAEIPYEYKDRIAYLQRELNALPAVTPYPKYGGSEPYPTFAETDTRRVTTVRVLCKMFEDSIAANIITSETVEKIFLANDENIDDSVRAIGRYIEQVEKSR